MLRKCLTPPRAPNCSCRCCTAVVLLLLLPLCTCLASVMSSCTSMVSCSVVPGFSTVLAWHSSHRGGLLHPFTCC
jgi:hypothetical protein